MDSSYCLSDIRYIKYGFPMNRRLYRTFRVRRNVLSIIKGRHPRLQVR
jgi:hypothetical protein